VGPAAGDKHNTFINTQKTHCSSSTLLPCSIHSISTRLSAADTKSKSQQYPTFITFNITTADVIYNIQMAQIIIYFK